MEKKAKKTRVRVRVRVIDDRIKKVIEIAKKQNISPTQMANLLGVSYNAYNNYVKGISKPINPAIIEKIKRFININK